MTDAAVVSEIRTRALLAPVVKPMDTPVGLLTARAYVIVEVRSSTGQVGIGYIRAYDKATVIAAKAFVDSFGRALIGSPVVNTEAMYGVLQSQLRLLGRAGPQIYAVSAIDTALWDLKARHLGLPLFRLLGAARESIPVYASGLMLDATIDELVDEAGQAARDGITALKMRVGKPDLDEDVRRIRAVRAAFDGQLMVDAGTAWTTPESLRAVRAFADLGITWIEDPLPVDGDDDLVRLNRASPIALAGGEHLFKLTDVARHISRHTYDYLILDLQRIGGITGWLRASHLATAQGMQVASHVFPEVAVHVLCGLSGGLMLEYLTWSYELFANPPRQRSGVVAPTEEPGLGLTIDDDFVSRHEIDGTA